MEYVCEGKVISDLFARFSGLEKVNPNRKYGEKWDITLQNKMTRTPLFMRYDMSPVLSPIGDAFGEDGQPHSRNSFLPEGAPSSVIASTS